MNPNIYALQKALKELGYDPGNLDGLNGRNTRAAARLFADGVLPEPAKTQVSFPASAVGRIMQGNTLVEEIVIHCSATKPEWMNGRTPLEQRNEIRRWHIEDRGWKDIGYHGFIARDGTFVAGRPLTTVGAHVSGHNTGTLGICLAGGFGSASTDLFDTNYTTAQKKTLIKVLREWSSLTPIKKISGHNQYAAKACPGFDVPTFLKTENFYYG